MRDGEKKVVGWESPMAVHPGKFLEETLEEFGMSQIDLAERTGLSTKVVNEIIKEKNPITRTTAFKLAKVFPISEDYWINLQNIYETDKARLEEETRIEEDKSFLPNFAETYKELARIGCSAGLRLTSSNSAKVVLELQKFFASDSLAYVEKEIEQFHFRKYKNSKSEINPYTLAAWLRLGKIKAYETAIPAYDEKKLHKLLGNVVHLSVENPYEYLPKLEKLLNECGVVLAYVPYLKNTQVQGAATWITKDKPLIMLNTSNKSEDRFWFNLFHEIGHILKHSKKEIFVTLKDGTSNVQEEEADLFAQKCLIANFDEVVTDFNKYPNHKEAIEKISKRINISPAILAGRIAHELHTRGRNVFGTLNEFFETKINYSNIKQTHNEAAALYLG